MNGILFKGSQETSATYYPQDALRKSCGSGESNYPFHRPDAGDPYFQIGAGNSYNDYLHAFIARFDMFNIDLPTDIKEPIVINDEILIFPNPSKGMFFIRLPDGYRGIGKVYDYSGKFAKEFKITESTHELNLSDLAKGMYFIQLIDMKKNESKSFKVILH